MTELEKMMSGLPYNSTEPNLKKLHMRGKRLMQKFNKIKADNTKKHHKILKKLLGGIDKNVRINPPFYIDYGCNIYIGENSFINLNCTFLDANKITIGKRVLIAPDVRIYTAAHSKNADERFDKSGAISTFTAPVRIGDDVWIGGGSIILPGVTIGNNVIIGAGSVVTKDVPDNTLAYGNPCRIIRNLKIKE